MAVLLRDSQFPLAGLGWVRGAALCPSQGLAVAQQHIPVTGTVRTPNSKCQHLWHFPAFEGGKHTGMWQQALYKHPSKETAT